VRKQWEEAGIALGATDVSETLSNPTGGIRQLTIYQGLLTGSLTLDLEKLAKWPGATFYADGYWISGEGLSENAIGNLLFVSSIEALASTRLHDLWLQQEFFDHRASIRIGQIAFDDESTSVNTRQNLSIRRSAVRTPCRTTCRAAGPAIHLRFQAPAFGLRQRAI
jgi:porin